MQRLKPANTRAYPKKPFAGLFAGLFLAVLFLSACGAADSAPGTVGRIELRIVYSPHGEGAGGARTWTLSCVPTGGSHPEPERACAELAAHPRALDPPRRACPLAAIQGAPSAAVSGRLGSRQVDRTVRPGCGPAWQQLHYLLSAQRQR